MDWCRAPRGRVKVSELRVPMDPLNPGQFFACCGLFELMAKAAPWACAHFVANEARPRRAEFVVQGEGLPQLETVLGALREATVEFDEEGEESVWPVRLSIAEEAFVLDWWLRVFREKPSNLKCWAGQVTTRKLFTDLMRLIEPDCGADRLMTAAKMSRSKFGVDPRFFTTKESGTGLGLPVAHRIVEQHGGILTAEANSDRGMTFSALLPLRHEVTV
jgi:hypothetical protein